MSDLTTRLNVALEGRYRIERQLGEGGNVKSTFHPDFIVAFEAEYDLAQ